MVGTTTARRAGRREGILIGTQGWSYPQWEGLVYPAGAPKDEHIAHYARRFPVVEIDSSYYGTPRAPTVARWAELVPDGFVFTAKVPGQVTQNGEWPKKKGTAAGWIGTDHAHRTLAQFFATMRLLGDHLGPVVFQMSPGFRYPRDFDSLAAALERVPALGGAGLDLAVEFRHPSWLEQEEPEALLREHGVAWVWNDWEPTETYVAPMPRAIDAPEAMKVTNDAFGYIRLTGNHDASIDYQTISIDRGADLARWAEKVIEFRRDRESRGIFVLLNNHYAGFSAQSVRELQRLLGLPVVTFG